MIRNYHKGDSFKVKVQSEQVGEASMYADFFDRITAFTLEDDNKEIMAVFGYMICEQNRAECFALIGENIGRNMLQLVRFLIRFIPVEMRAHHISKVWMTVKKDFRAGRRLAELIGFYFAAELPRFYLDEDYQLFERKEQWL